MVFIWLRFLPIFIPLAYFLSFKIFQYHFYLGWWSFIFLCLLIIVYFFLLFSRLKEKLIFLVLLHALILVWIGLIFFLILSGSWLINLFIVLWVVIYFLYLHSVFHYFYRTRSVIFANFKNIISYVDILGVFLAVSALFNLYIFLNVSWWLILLVFLLTMLVFLAVELFLYQLSNRERLFYILTISLVATELLASLLFWSLSFYVIGAILAIAYYLVIKLSIAYINDKFELKLISQYLFFSLAALALILLTANWL